MAENGMSEHIKQLFASARELLRPVTPRRLWGDVPVVPVVRLSGVIGMSSPLRPGLMLASVARQLERAFAMRRARAVALVINSPGGSAVQSRLIYLRIRSLAAEKKLPVIAFAEDVTASGGYMIACAADEIICDPSSIVGSIGVLGGTFGFPGLLQKLGVERRVYTSGERKAMLDPFLPEKPDEVERLKLIQREIVERGLDASPTTEVLIEESVLGWKEFEMEVVRDKRDNCIIICSIENLDPMGVHTGDSITIAPALTLTDKEYQIMRDASIAVLRE